MSALSPMRAVALPTMRERAGVLIEGLPGSGKSSLALALIDRGAVLVGDDGVALAKRDRPPVGCPAPEHLRQARNPQCRDGRTPATDAPVALVLQLEEAAPRYIDRAEEAWLEGLRPAAGAAVARQPRCWPCAPSGRSSSTGCLTACRYRCGTPARTPSLYGTRGAKRAEWPVSRSDSRPKGKQRILLVTGMLGAGKTTALRELEDLGWEAIDNFPIRLLHRLIGPDEAEPGAIKPPLAIGFDSPHPRLRSRRHHRAGEAAFGARRPRSSPHCSSTARPTSSSGATTKPAAGTRSRSGIPRPTGSRPSANCSRPLRRWADAVITTTALFDQRPAAGDPRAIRRFTRADAMTVTVSSFGFARGGARWRTSVFDMRYLDNPHWDDALRELTGLDAARGANTSARTSGIRRQLQQDTRAAARTAPALRRPGQELRQHRLRLHRGPPPLGLRGRGNRRKPCARRDFPPLSAIAISGLALPN